MITGCLRVMNGMRSVPCCATIIEEIQGKPAERSGRKASELNTEGCKIAGPPAHDSRHSYISSSDSSLI